METIESNWPEAHYPGFEAAYHFTAPLGLPKRVGLLPLASFFGAAQAQKSHDTRGEGHENPTGEN